MGLTLVVGGGRSGGGIVFTIWWWPMSERLFQHEDDYSVLFEDTTYSDGYSPPLMVAQRYVIACKEDKKKWTTGAGVMLGFRRQFSERSLEYPAEVSVQVNSNAMLGTCLDRSIMRKSCHSKEAFWWQVLYWGSTVINRIVHCFLSRLFPSFDNPKCLFFFI